MYPHKIPQIRPLTKNGFYGILFLFPAEIFQKVGLSMAKDKNITPEVIEYVKKLEQVDLLNLFDEKNTFKDEKGKPLKLSSDTLSAIAKGDYDHLLKEEKKSPEEKAEKSEDKTEEKKVEEEKSQGNKVEERKTVPASTETDNDEKSSEKAKFSLGKKKDSASSKVSFSDFQKRMMLAAALIIPMVIAAFVFKAEILQGLSEVAKSFAVVAAVLSMACALPFLMDTSIKKGLRILGFFELAVGFYVLSLGGAFITGVATLAVGILVLMLAF